MIFAHWMYFTAGILAMFADGDDGEADGDAEGHNVHIRGNKEMSRGANSGKPSEKDTDVSLASSGSLEMASDDAPTPIRRRSHRPRLSNGPSSRSIISTSSRRRTFISPEFGGMRSASMKLADHFLLEQEEDMLRACGDCSDSPETQEFLPNEEACESHDC